MQLPGDGCVLGRRSLNEWRHSAVQSKHRSRVQPRRMRAPHRTAPQVRACHAIHPITCVELEWSLFSRDAERDIVPTLRELGIGVLAYSPLGRGLLAGRFASADALGEKDFRRWGQPRFAGEAFEHNRALAARVAAVAERKGCTPAQLALAWLLAQGDDIIPIPGRKERRLRWGLGLRRIPARHRAVPAGLPARCSPPQSRIEPPHHAAAFRALPALGDCCCGITPAGTKSAARLEENLGALDVHLTPEVGAALCEELPCLRAAGGSAARAAMDDGTLALTRRPQEGLHALSCACADPPALPACRVAVALGLTQHLPPHSPQDLAELEAVVPEGAVQGDRYAGLAHATYHGSGVAH